MRPLSLSEFHNLKRIPRALLPLGTFPTTGTLGSCMTRQREILDLLRALDPSKTTSDLLVKALPFLDFGNRPDEISSRPASSCTASSWSASLATGSLHILTLGNQGSRNSGMVQRHRTSMSNFPPQAFLRIAPHILVCSPELVFVQMAQHLAYGELLALGYELCGCYPLPGKKGGALVRSPLTTPDRLVAFTTKLHSVHGIKLARAVARQVHGKSASPMETEVAALILTSAKRGGLEMGTASLNIPIVLSKKAEDLTRTGRVVCDLCWENNRLVLEYDGRASHGSTSQQDRDSRKRDALLLSNFELFTLTSAQFHNITEFLKLMERIALKLGKRPRKKSAAYLEKHMLLRSQLRSFHSQNAFCTDGPANQTLSAHQKDVKIRLRETSPSAHFAK